MPATEPTQARSPHRFVHDASARTGDECRHRRNAAVATLTAAPAQALQIVEASDGVSVEAILSIRSRPASASTGADHRRVRQHPFEPLRRRDGASHHAGHEFRKRPAAATFGDQSGGEVVLECDRDKGEIYVRPVGDSVKPINLFVSSATPTYTLLLRRADTPADTIVIRDKTPRR